MQFGKGRQNTHWVKVVTAEIIVYSVHKILVAEQRYECDFKSVVSEGRQVVDGSGADVDTDTRSGCVEAGVHGVDKVDEQRKREHLPRVRVT